MMASNCSQGHKIIANFKNRKCFHAHKKEHIQYFLACKFSMLFLFFSICLRTGMGRDPVGFRLHFSSNTFSGNFILCFFNDCFCCCYYYFGCFYYNFFARYAWAQQQYLMAIKTVESVAIFKPFNQYLLSLIHPTACNNNANNNNKPRCKPRCSAFSLRYDKNNIAPYW